MYTKEQLLNMEFSFTYINFFHNFRLIAKNDKEFSKKVISGDTTLGTLYGIKDVNDYIKDKSWKIIKDNNIEKLPNEYIIDTHINDTDPSKNKFIKAFRYYRVVNKLKSDCFVQIPRQYSHLPVITMEKWLKLIQMENKKIIGYKIKEGIDKLAVLRALKYTGDNLKAIENNEKLYGWHFSINSLYHQEAEKCNLLDVLFEPVYKKEEIILSVGNNKKIDVTIKKDSIFAEGKEVKLSDLTKAQDMFTTMNISGWEVSIPEIKIGCLTINKTDLTNIINTYKQL